MKLPSTYAALNAANAARLNIIKLPHTYVKFNAVNAERDNIKIATRICRKQSKKTAFAVLQRRFYTVL